MSLLATLATVKARLAIVGTTDDDYLTLCIEAACAQFQSYTNRVFAYAAAATYLFAPTVYAIFPDRLPVYSIATLEYKLTEDAGWVSLTLPDYQLNDSVILLRYPFPAPLTATMRLTYAGGYVLPPDTATPPQLALPSAIQLATIEQVAAWYLVKDRIPFSTVTAGTDTKSAFSERDLLPVVRRILDAYRRVSFS